jgi:Asp-tRNA(Asn)/Glu-tRNA(Gln) amidotransferase B subunit
MTVTLGAKWEWEKECERAQAALKTLIQENPDKVTQARERPQLIGWFVGRTAQAIGGTEHPDKLERLASEMLWRTHQ